MRVIENRIKLRDYNAFVHSAVLMTCVMVNSCGKFKTYNDKVTVRLRKPQTSFALPNGSSGKCRWFSIILTLIRCYHYHDDNCIILSPFLYYKTLNNGLRLKFKQVGIKLVYKITFLLVH